MTPGENLNQQTFERKSAQQDAPSSRRSDTKVLPKTEISLNHDRLEEKSENVDDMSKDSIQIATQPGEKDKQTKDEIEIKKNPKKESLKDIPGHLSLHIPYCKNALTHNYITFKTEVIVLRHYSYHKMLLFYSKNGIYIVMIIYAK